MFSTVAVSAPSARPVAPVLPLPAASRRPAGMPAVTSTAQRIAQMLETLKDKVPMQRRVVHAGEAIYQAGERFTSLYVVHSGIFKIVTLAADGREQLAGFQFKGDWMGFDGIASGCHGCDAIAMDTGEVWILRYDVLMSACLEHPPLLAMMHAAMSREIVRERESMMALCTLTADARVADFLRSWAEALAERGLRTDQITLRLTRAEIGNYLGMKLETVSRALSRLAREGLIRFEEPGRRSIGIPDVSALAAFVQRSLSPAMTTLQ
jgi:CRP/FNR family transcriptional regulator